MAPDTHAADGIRVPLAGQPFVEKKMMGGLVFMVEGHMCVVASGRDGLLLASTPRFRGACCGLRLFYRGT